MHGVAATPTPLLEDFLSMLKNGRFQFNFPSRNALLFRLRTIYLNATLITLNSLVQEIFLRSIIHHQVEPNFRTNTFFKFSPPDFSEYCALGTSMDCARAAAPFSIIRSVILRHITVFVSFPFLLASEILPCISHLSYVDMEDLIPCTLYVCDTIPSFDTLCSRIIPATFGQRLISFITMPPSILRGMKAREVAYPIAGKKPKLVKDSKEAVSIIKSGSHIFVHGIAATPTPLLEGLCEHAKANDLKKITLHHMHLEGRVPWLAPDVKGTADFNSIFLHEIPLLFRSGAIHLNAALITVSPPDCNGFCTLGTGVECTRAAVTLADFIIAICNKNMPRTFGDALIHESHIDFMVENDFPLHERIGAVPDAALNALCNHKNLGIHTEMFSDGVLKLVECNAITNTEKSIYPGKVSSFSCIPLG
ncbi:4-hydroxybutyrate coenzyme A transferase [Dirofilaria immitis]|nr:4-hydroxybutyrate coenzyme A transferase [Dirofilaria immitis]